MRSFLLVLPFIFPQSLVAETQSISYEVARAFIEDRFSGAFGRVEGTDDTQETDIEFLDRCNVKVRYIPTGSSNRNEVNIMFSFSEINPVSLYVSKDESVAFNHWKISFDTTDRVSSITSNFLNREGEVYETRRWSTSQLVFYTKFDEDQDKMTRSLKRIVEECGGKATNFPKE